MESKTCEADLLPIVKEVGATQIIYELSVDERGYCLSATSTGEYASSVRIGELTSNHSTALRILNLLAENLVFPLNVPEILDDLLAADAFI